VCSAGTFLKILKTFFIFKLLAKVLCVLPNYLAPSKLSNLSFLAGAKQLICRISRFAKLKHSFLKMSI